MKFHQDAYRTQLWSLQIRGKKTYIFCRPDVHKRSVEFPIKFFVRRDEDETIVDNLDCKSSSSSKSLNR